ncbi:MAG: B12-binding domain-containing radical SAM protein [Chloroflexi bacterium]|nr:B12-binding domain-containing radical SAM protein [Chloroflexota bacterium]
MDVVLIQPRLRFNRTPSRRASMPLGLMSVATPLDVAGYKVRIIDQRTEADWEKALLSELKAKPICVGVTAMTGPQIRWALKASEIVKRNSDVPVVWGGVHASLLPQQTLKNPYVDIVVQGEGEETFFELVSALGHKQAQDKVKGIWYKDGSEIKQTEPRPLIDLNKQAPLSYHLIDLKSHMMSMLGIDTAPFETSRGCPYNCAFCYNTAFGARRWRGLSAEETVSRIKRLVNDYGIRAVAFSDDNFFTDPNRAYQIFEGMIKQNLGIAWGKGDIRLDLLSKIDDDFLSLIERSGCLSLVIGIESGSQRIADVLRKDIDVSEIVPVNRRLAKYKMRPRYLFLVGTPGESETDLAKTTNLMLRLIEDNPKATVGVQIINPYPGTELFDLCLGNGLKAPQNLEEWANFTWANRRLDYPWLSPDRKKLLRMVSLCSYFLAKDNPYLFAEVSPFISLITKLYRPVAKKRTSGLHYRFFPEVKVAELLGYTGM